jgi:hypothetical protein
MPASHVTRTYVSAATSTVIYLYLPFSFHPVSTTELGPFEFYIFTSFLPSISFQLSLNLATPCVLTSFASCSHKDCQSPS